MKSLESFLSVLGRDEEANGGSEGPWWIKKETERRERKNGGGERGERWQARVSRGRGGWFCRGEEDNIGRPILQSPYVERCDACRTGRKTTRGKMGHRGLVGLTAKKARNSEWARRGNSSPFLLFLLNCFLFSATAGYQERNRRAGKV
jgi:hypothetical protein